MFHKLGISIFFVTFMLAVKAPAAAVDWEALLHEQNEAHFLQAVESIVLWPPIPLQGGAAAGQLDRVQLPIFIQMRLARIIGSTAQVSPLGIGYGVIEARFQKVMSIFNSQNVHQSVLANLANQMAGSWGYSYKIGEFLKRNAANLGPEVQKELVNVILGSDGRPEPTFESLYALEVLGEVVKAKGVFSTYVKIKLGEWFRIKSENLYFQKYGRNVDWTLAKEILSAKFADESDQLFDRYYDLELFDGTARGVRRFGHHVFGPCSRLFGGE